MEEGLRDYQSLVGTGESLEDARGVLPINVHCNLIAKYNLRTLVDLLRSRDSLRVQGEYRDIASQMRKLVTDIWPWSEPFFVPKHEKAIRLIENVAMQTHDKELRIVLAKAADLLKK